METVKMDFFKTVFKHIYNNIFILFKWVLFAVITALIIGSVGSLFYILVAESSKIRQENDFIIALLPFAGLFIAFIYRRLDGANKQGTNLVLASISANKNIPLKMLPLIFISTIITHLFGGSAGREGAALQIGGSLGNFFGNIFKVDDKDRHVVIMCGMTAAFTALFGTPIAATFFSMEVVSVGIMHYSALVPCAVAAIVSKKLAEAFGISAENFVITSGIPEISFASIGETFLLAVLCAGLSVSFCIILHKTEHIFRKNFRNHYLRIFIGGLIITSLTFALHTRNYNGAGMEIIEKAVSGEVNWYDFILKILFTAVTLGSGFRGGEIVPTLFAGATFGCLFGNIIGFSPGLCSAIGMISLFCGVTNCPVTSLFIGFELFGIDGLLYYLLAVSVSYMLSGYYGLYKSQKIVYSKYKSEYINTTAHK